MTWADIIDRLEVKFPFKVEVRAEVTRDDQCRIQCTLHVPDVITGEPTMVHQIDYPPPLDRVDDPYWYLRKFILRSLAHELDEGIVVDGVRIFDPHQADPTGGSR